MAFAGPQLRGAGAGSAALSWPDGSTAVVKYLTRYLTRDFCEHIPRRGRLTSGRAENKVGTTRFQWVNGLAKAWRAGCEDFLKATKVNPLTVAWLHRDHIMPRGFAVLGLGDWDGYLRERALARARELGPAGRSPSCVSPSRVSGD